MGVYSSFSWQLDPDKKKKAASGQERLVITIIIFLNLEAEQMNKKVIGHTHTKNSSNYILSPNVNKTFKYKAVLQPVFQDRWYVDNDTI